jgi:hypothetical protein
MGRSQDRAEERASWPVRRFKLGEEPSEDLRETTTAEQRLAMMWPLALDAWASMGKPLPEYTRDTMPGRIVRRGVGLE